MNVTLSLEFDNLDELQAFLASNPRAVAAQTQAEVPSGAPTLTPVPTPEPTPEPAPEPTPEPAPEIVTENADDHRARLMTLLREKASGMDDGGASLGKFINNFGVAKFSDLEDDQLPAFEAALVAEFGS